MTRNDQLHSILDPRGFFQWQTNGSVEVQAPWSAADRLRRAIESPSLSEQEFTDELQRRIVIIQFHRPPLGHFDSTR
jgi:hypothetical protein